MRPITKKLAMLLAAALVGGASYGTQSQERLDTAELDTVEDLSESLANDLLALSVATRDKDRRSIDPYFAETLASTPLPNTPTEPVPKLKWISTHGWRGAGAAPIETLRDDFLGQLEGLLEHFPSIEDIRFKVKEAEFEHESTNFELAASATHAPRQPVDGATLGRARVYFYIVGRDPQGRREWLTGWIRIEAGKSGEDPWRILRFELESLESMIAETELFSEVALPAGVHTSFPAFGTAPNDTVVAHGGAVADVNGDGLLDLATTGVEQNHLYVNDGTGGFRDVSAETLVGLAPAGTGSLFLDYDNDGDADLFLAATGSQVLLENRLVPDGELRFFDRSLEAGVSVPAIGFSAAAADVNGDGWQDIYVTSYNRYGLIMPNSWDRATNGTPNLFFLNQGDGTFREVANAWGVRDSRWSYAAAFADIDEDGDQDLYVANDFGENALYINEGDRYREAAAERGVIDPGNGMGVAFGDYDNDGDLDLHVTNMSSTAGNRILQRLYPEANSEDLVLRKLAAGNSLYENNGDGTFQDVSRAAGGFSAGWAWGGGFIDFDNDGWEDLYSPNGFISGKTMNDT